MRQTPNKPGLRVWAVILFLCLGYLLIGASAGATAQANPPNGDVSILSGSHPLPCTAEQMKEFYAAAAGHPTKPPPTVTDPSIHPDIVPPLCALPGIPADHIQSLPPPLRLPNTGKDPNAAPTMERIPPWNIAKK